MCSWGKDMSVYMVVARKHHGSYKSSETESLTFVGPGNSAARNR